MRNHALVIAVALGSSVVVSSCGQTHLIGEDSCYGEETRCESDAPTLTTLGAPPHVFDVVSSRTLTPRWTMELPCEELCAVQLAAGDGSLWTNLSETTGSTLIELDDDSVVVETYETARPGSLVMDSAREAHLVRWESGGLLRIKSPAGGGMLAERTLQVPRVPVGSIRFTNLDPDGSVSITSFEADGTFVARYDASGALRWKQSNLRVAKRFPYEDLGPGIVPTLGYDVVPLGDGSLLLGLPKYTGDDREERSITMRWQGITLLGQDGNVRWDALVTSTLTTQPVRPLFASGPDASFIMAHGTQDALFVSIVDNTGQGLAQWLGQRVDYHSVAPGALCVDSAGSIYAALLGGERDQRRHMLCKFDSTALEAEPSCALLELPEPLDPLQREEGLGGLGLVSFGLSAIACPAPGRVVVAPLPRNPELRQALVGFEF